MTDARAVPYRHQPRAASRPLLRPARESALQGWRKALLVFLAMLPLAFMPLESIGLGFLKPPQLALALLLAFAPFVLPGSREANDIARKVAFAYAANFAILLLSFAWSPDAGAAAVFLFVDLILGAAAICVLLMLSRVRLDHAAFIFVVGAALIAVVLHLTIWAGLAVRGQFGPFVAMEILASGNLRWLKQFYFISALKGLGLQGTQSFFSEVAPRSTNVFGSAIITPTIAAVSLYLANIKMGSRPSALMRALLIFAVFNAAAATVIAFSDRVTVYAALVVLLNLFFFGFVQSNPRLKFTIVYFTIIGAGLTAIYFLADIAARGGFIEFFEDFWDNPRFNDMHLILMRLNEAGLMGDGMGTSLDLPGIDYLFPHNIFLSNFLFAGIVGLAAAIVWVGVLVALFIEACKRMSSDLSTPAEQRLALGAASILLYNITLTQLAAQGLFDLNDWIGLAFGLFLLVKAREAHTYGNPRHMAHATPRLPSQRRVAN